jgi:hypothetical protein
LKATVQVLIPSVLSWNSKSSLWFDFIFLRALSDCGSASLCFASYYSEAVGAYISLFC